MLVTIGEIVVELMATCRGQSFRAPGLIHGPFPSGAPAIFIDQVAKLGFPSGIVSAVGDDDFGRLNIDRLRGDGVDVSAVAIVDGYTTGSAFVRYHDDGKRDFIFNIAHSACGRISLTEPAGRMLAKAVHLHIMGSSLFGPEVIAAVKAAIAQVKTQGGTISFDPNLRKEMLGQPGMREALQFVLAHCDIFLPSGPEITLLTEATTEADAVRELLARGVGTIVIKHGAAGASYYDRRRYLYAPGFAVEEIDPTGAGDCFGATFVTCRLRGLAVEAALRLANAAGARAVTLRGPMEGTTSLAELEDFIVASQLGAVA